MVWRQSATKVGGMTGMPMRGISGAHELRPAISSNATAVVRTNAAPCKHRLNEMFWFRAMGAD